jgi:PadR family transcriptional regulator PadR
MAEADDHWLAQMRKGTLELCMLALLANQERYGYQIAQGLAESGGLAVGEGTIYPLLSRLQREGLVSAAWRESPAGPPRKYYRLTSAGSQLLGSKIQAWQQLSQAVDGILEEARNGKPADG